MKIRTLIATLIFSLLFTTTAMPKSFTVSKGARNKVNLIAKMIKIVQPGLEKNIRNRIAYSIYLTTKKYKVDPKLMIAIIGTESDFQNEKVSTTGDISLAQINTEIWNKEFVRMGLGKLNSKRLKKDEHYALSKMAEILTILKERHSKNDSKWFARYHSQTKKFKNLYCNKIEKRMRMIALMN